VKMAYKKYKGRPEMAKELKRLMWEEGLPIRKAADVMGIKHLNASILCDYYGIETRDGFDYVNKRKPFTPELVHRVLMLVDEGVMNRDIGRLLPVNKDYVTRVRWLFQINPQKFRANITKLNGSTHRLDIGTPQQWIIGCEDSARYWKDRNPLHHAYWRNLATAMQGRDEPLSLVTQDEIWESTKRTMQNMTKT